MLVVLSCLLGCARNNSTSGLVPQLALAVGSDGDSQYLFAKLHIFNRTQKAIKDWDHAAPIKMISVSVYRLNGVKRELINKENLRTIVSNLKNNGIVTKDVSGITLLPEQSADIGITIQLSPDTDSTFPGAKPVFATFDEGCYAVEFLDCESLVKLADFTYNHTRTSDAHWLIEFVGVYPSS